jgi:hypothetical protein
VKGTLRIVLVLACLSLLLAAVPAPAGANSYPGLVEKEWYAGNDVLNARLAIEVNSANEGRFRLHLRCFYVEEGGRRVPQECDFRFDDETCWYAWTSNPTGPICRVPGAVNDDADYTWVGQYRKLYAGVTYEVTSYWFKAYFERSNRQGGRHNICTRPWTAFQSSSGTPWC